ncbi:MAG TPA: hypothetical protein VKP64_13645 [Mycobacteriales bacterium]|nr:hypothetical protein [Mycobacteriales bacterium]
MELTGLNCNGNPLNPLPGVGPKHTDDLCRTIGLAGLLGAVQLVRGINREWAKHVYCAPHTFHLSQGAGDVRRMLEYAGPKLAHVPIDFDGIATLRVFALGGEGRRDPPADAGAGEGRSNLLITRP